MAVLQVGTSLAQIGGNNKSLTSQAQQVASGAVKQTQSDLDILTTRGEQISSTITLDQIRRIKQGTRERSTLQARAADSGVAGGSSVRDTVASIIQEELDLSTLDTQRDWSLAQNELEKREAITRGQSTLNQAKSILGQRTSGVSGVLQLIGAGISGYSQGKMLEPTFTGKVKK